MKLDIYLSTTHTHFLAGTGARAAEEVVNLAFSNIKYEQLKGAFTWAAFIDKSRVSGKTGDRKIILASRAIEALEYVVSLTTFLQEFY